MAAAGRTMGRLYLSMAACMLIVVLLFAGVGLAVWGLLFGIVLWIWVYAIGAITDRCSLRPVSRKDVSFQPGVSSGQLLSTADRSALFVPSPRAVRHATLPVDSGKICSPTNCVRAVKQPASVY